MLTPLLLSLLRVLCFLCVTESWKGEKLYTRKERAWHPRWDRTKLWQENRGRKWPMGQTARWGIAHGGDRSKRTHSWIWVNSSSWDSPIAYTLAISQTHLKPCYAWNRFSCPKNITIYIFYLRLSFPWLFSDFACFLRVCYFRGRVTTSVCESWVVDFLVISTAIFCVNNARCRKWYSLRC